MEAELPQVEAGIIAQLDVLEIVPDAFIRIEIGRIGRQSLDELNRAGASDSDIDKIGWQNSARFFNWDPLKHHTREEISVGALRQAAADVDVSIRSRAEWARRYHEKQAAAAT